MLVFQMGKPRKTKWLFRGPFVFLTVTTGGRGCRVCPAGCSPQKSHQMATFLHTGAVKKKKNDRRRLLLTEMLCFGGETKHMNADNGWMDTQIRFLTVFLMRLLCFWGVSDRCCRVVSMMNRLKFIIMSQNVSD